jgi:hypothetical protein
MKASLSLEAKLSFREQRLGCKCIAGTVFHAVIAGLDPAISIEMAQRCQMNRDGRDKPGHDMHRCLTS